MIQKTFAERVKTVLKNDDFVIGLAVGGSWLTNEIDEYSDLDLVVVTKDKITQHKEKMFGYAKQFGNFLSGFTGEHVGEPRVLICLYDEPLLHVDLKFVTVEEFKNRVESPVLLLDKGGQLQQALVASEGKFPYPDYQWIEDRFWIWIHYALLKIGRGEYLEAFDFLGYLRMVVLGPLLHIKNNNLPRGVRKVETQLNPDDLNALIATVPSYNRDSLLKSLQNTITLYKSLREALYTEAVLKQTTTEEKVEAYFKEITLKTSP